VITVSAPTLDLGRIRREVLDLRQRVQVVADDLDVRTLALQVFLAARATWWPNE
jgi:hypothetical protein